MTDLPKWPGLLVTGDRVTPDQAAEIIVRCQDFYFSTNDRKWERQLAEAVGLDLVGLGKETWSARQTAREQHRTLPIDYLGLGGRIASCYIGGPHGWLDWGGNVFCNSFNIGKWPSVESVEREWTEIASAFPFLSLRCQLLNREIYNEDGDADVPPYEPLVEWAVANGTVERIEPKALLVPPAPGDIMAAVWGVVGALGRERGCRLEQFERGLRLAREATP